MEVVLYAGVSVDGFISTLDGNSDWVEDNELFEEVVTDFRCIALGRTTFEQYPEDYPIEGITHIVLSNRMGKSSKSVHYVDSVEAAIGKTKELGFKQLLVIGGSKTNGSFIRSGSVKKLLLDVHPLVLGTGKKLLGDFTEQLDLKLLKSQQYEGFVHMEYQL